MSKNSTNKSLCLRFGVLFLIGVASITASAMDSQAHAGDVDFKHYGDDRCFDLKFSRSDRAMIRSYGDGGCLDVKSRYSDDMDVFMMGDDIEGRVRSYGGSGSVFLGMCPPGMRLPTVHQGPGRSGVSVPRCVHK